MKNIVIFSVCIIMLYGADVHANSTQKSSQNTYLINSLLAQIASLQALLEEKKSGTTISGTPSIAITSPSSFLNVKYGNSYTVSWDAKNIPPSAKLLLDTNAAILYGGSGVSGGLYESPISPKSTKGSLTVNTGIGYSAPGTYDIQAIVVACADILCSKPVVTYNTTGDRVYLTKILAKSTPVRFSISENDLITSVGDGTITIGDITPKEGKFRLDEEMKISYYIFGDPEEGQKACFYFHSATGKYFSPSSNTYEACVPAKTGLNVRYWTPHRTSGFNLDPGLYQIDIVVPNVPNNSGKDAGNAAEKSSGWIDLLPEV